MTSDVEVTISGGLPFDEKAVQGITITYGINSIPTARLILDAPWIQQRNPEFLCNPTVYKKRNGDNLVTIKVNSKTGCLKFEGYFDGLNISQSSSGFEYCAVIKNEFQRLFEIYPRCVGIVPSSCLPFLASAPLSLFFGDSDASYQPAYGQSAFNQLDTNVGVATYILTFIKALIKTQTELQTSLVTTDDINGLFKLMNDTIYQQNIKAALPLLEKVNTDYVDDCPILAAVCAARLIEQALGQQTDVWNLLITSMEYIGCCVVVANDTLYVIPHVEFMKMDHDVPGFQEPSTGDNQANPVEYNNFSVSDNGFVNIRYCYLVVEGLTQTTAGLTSVALTQNLGIYPASDSSDEGSNEPDDGSSGILLAKADSFLFNSVVSCLSRPSIQTKIAGQQPNAGNPVTEPKPVATDLQQLSTSIDEKYKNQTDYVNYYAEAKFLQSKYSDRIGGVSLQFTPEWMPGTTGSIYTRTPGTFIQFFVQTVTHTIRMSAPNNGTALTEVAFNSARQGATGNIPGVSSMKMYNYDTQKMTSLQKDWINNITDNE